MNGQPVAASVYRCQICKIDINSTKPSNVQWHLTSINHRESFKMSQGGSLLTNT
jgi:hypothetical protein